MPVAPVAALQPQKPQKKIEAEAATEQLELGFHVPEVAKPKLNHKSIRLVWSVEGYEGAQNPDYTAPKGVATLPGNDFIEKLTNLLKRFASGVEISASYALQFGGLILDEAEEFCRASMEAQDLTPHQQIHVLELVNNFNRTVEAIISLAAEGKGGILRYHPRRCGLAAKATAVGRRSGAVPSATEVAAALGMTRQNVLRHEGAAIRKLQPTLLEMAEELKEGGNLSAMDALSLVIRAALASTPRDTLI